MQTQTKKKNRLFRWGLLVLALAVVSFSLISGTLARNVSSDGSAAGVARFDFTAFDANGVALGGPDQIISIFETSDMSIREILDDTRLIAPGSTGTFSVVLVNSGGSPVTTEVKFAEENVDGIPLVYTFNDLHYSSVTPVDGKVGGLEIAGNIDALSAAVSQYSSLGNAGAGNTARADITWTWAFSADDAQTDEGDTALAFKGDAAVKFSVNAVATQIA